MLPYSRASVCLSERNMAAQSRLTQQKPASARHSHLPQIRASIFAIGNSKKDLLLRVGPSSFCPFLISKLVRRKHFSLRTHPQPTLKKTTCDFWRLGSGQVFFIAAAAVFTAARPSDSTVGFRITRSHQPKRRFRNCSRLSHHPFDRADLDLTSLFPSP